jgi:TolA-binding protein
MSYTSRAVAVALLTVSLGATPAFAVNKDMIQLQTQIQQLQDAVARLQQSNDERMGVLKDLVQQSADSVNRMSLNMDALQKQMRAQQDAQGGKLDQLSTQIQALNDSLDEMKARIARLDKALADIQSQQQAMGTTLNSLQAPQGTTAPLNQPPQSQAPVNQAPPNAAPAGPIGNSPLTDPNAPAAVPVSPAPSADAGPAPGSTPSLRSLWGMAYGDYMARKLSLASSEFKDLIKAYPEDARAGFSYYYLGEIDYMQGHYASAAKNYDHVVEDFPGNKEIPPAQLHKGMALALMGQKEAAAREYHSLISRYPTSPEAGQARSKLNALARQ